MHSGSGYIGISTSLCVAPPAPVHGPQNSALLRARDAGTGSVLLVAMTHNSLRTQHVEQNAALTSTGMPGPTLPNLSGGATPPSSLRPLHTHRCQVCTPSHRSSSSGFLRSATDVSLCWSRIRYSSTRPFVCRQVLMRAAEEQEEAGCVCQFEQDLEEVRVALGQSGCTGHYCSLTHSSHRHSRHT